MATETGMTRYNQETFMVDGEPRDNALYVPTSDQKFPYGKRGVTWDGRVFKYIKAADALVSYHGAGASKAAKMSYEAIGSNEAIGATSVEIVETGLTLDELVGAYLALYNASDVMQWRGVVGNDVSGSANTRIYLDAPLHAAVTTAATNAELFYNPYKYCTHVADEYTSVICVPAAGTASGYSGWGQTWGPALISPGETIDSPAAGARNLVFGANYVLFKNATKTSGQNAGFYLNSGSASIAGPMIFLQITPV